jgi:hypothetical protein
LIFMELGFLNALLESTVQLLRKVDGEIVIVGSAQYALMAGERLTPRSIRRAGEGVASVSPVTSRPLPARRIQGERRSSCVLAIHVEDQPPTSRSSPAGRGASRRDRPGTSPAVPSTTWPKAITPASLMGNNCGSSVTFGWGRLID